MNSSKVEFRESSPFGCKKLSSIRSVNFGYRETSPPLLTAADGHSYIRTFLKSSFSPTDQLYKNIQRLAEFRGAQRNWNGYGAQPFDSRALHNATSLILALNSQQPFVAPLTNGGVQLEWQDSGRELELEVRPDGFTYQDDKDQEHQLGSVAEALAFVKDWLRG